MGGPTPPDQELDVRPVARAEHHPLIFAAFDRLAPAARDLDANVTELPPGDAIAAHAGPEDLRYLSVHRRKPGLAITAAPPREPRSPSRLR